MTNTGVQASGHDTSGHDKRIVVAFNGSPAAWDAVRWASDEAAQRQATLDIVTCVADGPEADGPEADGPEATAGRAPGGSDMGTARQELDDAARVARNRGWQAPITVLLAPGSPGQVLVDHSRGAVMLVLGRQDPHSVTPPGRNSLSSYCLTHADCPVTVVTSATRPGHLEADERHLDDAAH